jgi:hypothetical protein
VEEGGRGVELYRLLCVLVSVPVSVPISLSVALCSSELIESFECSCNSSDAAHKQDYSLIGNFLLVGGLYRCATYCLG